MNQFDVLICGGGPAGSTCALALAESGLTVAVIDKASFPRDKICGDAVAAYVPKVLNTINPKYKAALQSFNAKAEVTTCRVVSPGGRHFDIVSPESGFIAPRLHWDNFLYEMASAEPNITYFLNHAITDVQISAGKAEVTANGKVFTGKLVIGCDGAHSMVVKKTTGHKPDLEHYSGAVRGYFKNVTGIPPKTYELHFLHEALPGYFWIFPLENNMANVGLGVQSAEISRRKLNLRQMMETIIKTHPEISKRFKEAELIGKIEGFGLPLGSRRLAISGERFMLCGDAASLIDPATGEGIGQAMISGRYAGWQAIECFKQQNFSAAFMKAYDRQVYKKLGSSFKVSYFLQRVIFTRPRLFNNLFSLLLRSTSLRKLAIKILS